MSDFKIGKPNPGAGGGGGFVKADHEDHLLAFVTVTYEESIQTKFGDSDAARVEAIVCFDDGEIINDALIFGTALVPRLTGTEDDIVLGRLVKGEAKAGQSAPWLLEDPLDIDEKRAEDFFERNATRLRSGRIVIEPPEDNEKF